MSEFRIAKLEALLARVVTRAVEPRPVAAAPAPAVAARVPPHAVATTPPPPPVAVPEVSIPRQPVLASVTEAPAAGVDDFQESTYVSRSSEVAPPAASAGPALVPHPAESHARIATAPRADDESRFVDERPADVGFAEHADDERAPVSSERTVDPSLEADSDSATAPPESTRQLATSPPSAQARAASVRPSVMPDSAPRSVGTPVITRGSLPPDANDAVEFRGELPARPAPTVGDLLDATLLL